MLAATLRSVRDDGLKQIYLIRHGQTEWNLQGRMQGRMDSPLTEQGQLQAIANGKLLRTLGGVEKLWVSPSGRTTETAFLINSHVKAELDFADELMERDCGSWSGQTVADIEAGDPLAWAERLADPYWYQPPGGENLQDMLLRVHDFLDGLFDSQWQAIGLVTHGVMSKVILKFFLSLGELECGRASHPNDLVYRLTFTAEDIETHHFIAGGNAQSGLLHRTQT
jgi:broad specificity phosphatase PhoE